MPLGNEPVRYKHGDWYVICDRTGFKIKASEARREWNGLLVHKSVWEPRHPQDFVKGTRDVQSPPFTRGESTDTFVGPLSLEGDALGSLSLEGDASGVLELEGDFL